jgi:DNA-binding MarR family transcriptional regulator
VIPVDFVAGLALGLLLAGALYLVLWYWARRTRAAPPAPAARALPAERGPESPVSAPVAMPTQPGYPASPEPSPVITGPPRGPGAITVPPAEAGVAPVLPPGPVRPPEPSSTADRVRLSQRVILHVYSQGELPPGAVAPPGLCQGGIGEALGLSQGGLAAVLSRLEAAGILTTERGHVQGRDRRLKIYRLSAQGLQLAQELRARNGLSPGRRPARRKGAP